MVLKLLEINRILDGSLVKNILKSGSATGSSIIYDYTTYLQVWKEADKFCIDKKMTPSSFRDDGVHPSELGGSTIGELLAWKIKTLGFSD